MFSKATANMAKKPKQNETKTKLSSIMEIQVSAHFSLLNLYYIHIILFMAPELERKNNTSCKTCLVINLEIKIIQFPLTPVPISSCIFPCTVLFVESASSHRSARSLETLFFFWLQYVGQVRKTYNEKDHNETKWLKMHSQNTS